MDWRKLANLCSITRTLTTITLFVPASTMDLRLGSPCIRTSRAILSRRRAILHAESLVGPLTEAGAAREIGSRRASRQMANIIRRTLVATSRPTIRRDED